MAIPFPVNQIFRYFGDSGSVFSIEEIGRIEVVRRRWGVEFAAVSRRKPGPIDFTHGIGVPYS